MLEGITVLADRFEVRRRSVGTLSYASDQPALLQSSAPTLAEFIAERHQVPRVPCRGDAEEEENCLRFRSRTAHPAIYVDDMLMPGGVTVLDAFDPDQLYRLEVYPLLHQVRLYTTHYVESLALSGRSLPPICIVC